MSSHGHYNVRIRVGKQVKQVVTRLRPVRGGGAETQSLAVSATSLYEICFSDNGYGRVALGPEIVLKGLDVVDAVWDSFSSSIILLTETAVHRLTHDNKVQVLAGKQGERANVDGTGTATRFSSVRSICSNGSGPLYVASNKCIRQLQLPECLQGRWQATLPASGGGAGSDVVVTTLPFEAASDIGHVVHVPHTSGASCSSIVFATSSAIYRVALGPDGDPVAAAAAPELLAGREDDDDHRDGEGPRARFAFITGITADAHDSLFVTDGEYLTNIRKVTPGGRVVTLTTDIGVADVSYLPSILPNGSLALTGSNILVIIDIRLWPVPLVASAALAAAATISPPARTLPDDLGALLDRQPDGTADISLLVGDRAFPVHRGVLAARSDYFRQRFQGGFTDGGERQLSLPDADPDAFALVLRFIYTGRAALPEALAPAVAELADRLLLPELCREAQGVVLAEVRPETVVERLLWAESQGGSFAPLLADLQAWYVAHDDEVLETASESLVRLSAESPALMVDLLRQGKRARLR